jgi:hypothetical protein
MLHKKYAKRMPKMPKIKDVGFFIKDRIPQL